MVGRSGAGCPGADSTCRFFESKNTLGHDLRQQSFPSYLHSYDGSVLFAHDAIFYGRSPLPGPPDVEHEWPPAPGGGHSMTHRSGGYPQPEPGVRRIPRPLAGT
ncbi:AbfB domain-containing protein [Streptomyces sp. NPDC001910]|uniref:AbfB domain-containing protein n=1 Tax=Streptomyces sp. NPDC001910 TaxID=3154403 RepID=UPI00332F8A28